MRKSITLKQVHLSFFFLVFLLNTPLLAQLTVDQIMGANARERDPVSRMKAVGFIREYHNWFFNEGYPDGSNPINYSLGYPNAQYKWNAPYQDTSPTTLFDDFYQDILTNQLSFAPSFLGTIRQLVDPNSTLPFGEHIIDEFKPVAPSADTLNPASYLAHAAYMYQYAARYGHQIFTTNQIDSFITPFTHPAETPKTGLGFVDYMENWNEQDKFWFRDFNGAYQTYFTPAVYAAMLSADYDGHEQTMGLKEDPDNPGNMISTVGIKNADSTMKVVIGGLAVADIAYFRAIVTWAKANRTNVPLEKVLPFDALNIHKYTGDSLAFLNSRFGISPEAGKLRDTLLTFATYRDSLETAFNVELELWLSEFGYDTYTPAPGSPSGVAPAIGDNDNYEVQGQWLVRSYLEALAAGVEKAIMFDLRDECTDPDNPNSACGLFSSSGLLENIHNDYKPKTSWFYTYTMKNVLTGMVFDNDLSNCLDTSCTRVYRFKDPAGSNKRVYAIWQPTSSDDTTAYHFLNEDLTNATLVKLEAPSIRGISSNMSDPFPTLTITERPIFIIVNETYFITQSCAAGSISTNNPTCNSINVLIDVPQNSSTYQLWSMQGSFAASEFSHRSATLLRETLLPTDSIITVPNLLAGTFYTFFLIPEGVGISESNKICTTQNTTLAATSNCYLTIQTDWIFDDFENSNPITGLNPYTLFDEQFYGDSICRASTTLPSSIWGFNDAEVTTRSVSLDLQSYYYIDLFTLHDQFSEGDFTIQMADSPNGPWTTIGEYYTTLNNAWTHLTNLTPPNTPIRYLKFIAAANNEAKVGELLICGRVADFNPDIVPGVAKNGSVSCDTSELSWQPPFDDDILGYKIIDDVTKIILDTAYFVADPQTYQLPMANEAINFAIVTLDTSYQESPDTLRIIGTNLPRISDCQIPLTPAMIFDYFNELENAQRLVDEQMGYDPICNPSIVPTTNFWGVDYPDNGVKEQVSLDLGAYYTIDQIIMHDGNGANGHIDLLMAISPNGPWVKFINYEAINDGWVTFLAPIPNNALVRYIRLEASSDNQVNVGELFICGTIAANFNPDIAPGVARSGQISHLSCDSVVLAWQAPFDKDIASYAVYSNENLIETTNTTNISIGNLISDTTYTFKIITIDSTGNTSLDSLLINFTTNEASACDLNCNFSCACAICIRPNWITQSSTAFDAEKLVDEQDLVPTTACNYAGNTPQSFWSYNFSPTTFPVAVEIDLQSLYDLSEAHFFFQGSTNKIFSVEYKNANNEWVEFINTTPAYGWHQFDNLAIRAQFIKILHNDQFMSIGEVGFCGTPFIPCVPTLSLSDTLMVADTFQAGIITSNAVLTTGTTISYLAENTITMSAGFHAVAGVNFSAKIAPCNDDFTTPTANSTFSHLPQLSPSPVLSQNNLTVYPNPFQSQTTIAYYLSQPTKVQLAIFDATGRLVNNLVPNQLITSGPHVITFDTNYLENGLYIARLQVGQEVLLQRMILMK